MNTHRSTLSAATTVPRSCHVSHCAAAAVARVRWHLTAGGTYTHGYCRRHVDAITDRIAPCLPAGVAAVEVMSR